MNRGLLPGLNADGWRHFTPQLFTAGAGGETQPTIDSIDGHTYQFGRYARSKELVVAEMQMQFVGTCAAGSGSAYVMRLPVPGQRPVPGASTNGIRLGKAMAYLSIGSPFVNVPMVPTLADPFVSLNNQEDSYVQCYVPYILSWGTGTLAASTATVTHQCGYTPRAEDIEITFTDQAGVGAGSGVYQLLSIGATTFVVQCFGAAAVAAFSWKVRGKPPTGSTGSLLSPTAPFDWTRTPQNTNPNFGPYGNIFIQVAYEPRF